MEYVILFFIGVCGTTLGTIAGGGGLISLPAMLLLGVPIHSAIGANKVSNTVSSFSSILHLTLKKQLSLKQCVWIIPVSLAGGISGSYIATNISEEKMGILAVFLLLFAFITSFVRKKSFFGEESLKPNKISITGLYMIGSYDGMFGPGQGTLMLYLFSFLNIAYIKAVGYVRLATFSSCIGAAITYILSGKVIWPVTIALLLGSVTGAQIGIRIAERIRSDLVKPIIRIVLLALIIQISLDYFPF
jgi:uncharacterized protein